MDPSRDFSYTGLGEIKCIVDTGIGTLIPCQHGLLYKSSRGQKYLVSWESFEKMFNRVGNRPNK